jgi:hypothetical protein
VRHGDARGAPWRARRRGNKSSTASGDSRHCHGDHWCAHPPRGPTFTVAAAGPSNHAKRLNSKKWQDNNSVDFLAPPGTSVYALVDGTVCDPAKDSKCV